MTTQESDKLSSPSKSGSVTIKRCEDDALWPEMWAFMHDVFASGASYPVAPDISEIDAKRYWFHPEKTIFAACGADGSVLGTYYIRANQPDLGDHICNCGYMVSPQARGQGVATQMCRHSQDIAREMGFRGMQYNLVVVTNTAAVSLWTREGFHIVGTLPQAFRHKTDGFVDAYVMFKTL